jgi:hypothetical protein
MHFKTKIALIISHLYIPDYLYKSISFCPEFFFISMIFNHLSCFDVFIAESITQADIPQQIIF